MTKVKSVSNLSPLKHLLMGTNWSNLDGLWKLLAYKELYRTTHLKEYFESQGVERIIKTST